MNRELLSKLRAKHGAALQKATARRDAKEADEILAQLPELDVAGNTTAIIIPKKARKDAQK